jgi:Protein of unknown function (DUF3300)
MRLRQDARIICLRLISGMLCASLIAATMPLPLEAQDAAPAANQGTTAPAAAGESQDYTVEQLDALLAPIALYPDQLLTQILMASTFPLQIVDADRWIQDPANKALTGDPLEKALQAKDWDPSVKSLVPFPDVLNMMSKELDWTQQLGYAMTMQQKDVLNSVQRLRAQAQETGNLKSTEQQVVSQEGSAIVIQPAQPNVVYVPSYNPTVVYGTWPYPAYPPVYYPSYYPPAYYPGAALATGLAFGAGIAITAGLWGLAGCNWGRGDVNVNVNRYNNINANRGQIKNSNWQANRGARGSGNFSGTRPGGGRPPGGPVGRPGRSSGMPANGIGRPSVSVPGNITRPPAGMGSGNRPGAGQGGRPGTGQGAGGRPGAGQGAGGRPSVGQGAGGRPSVGQGGGRPSAGQGNRPSTRPAQTRNRNNGPSAFNGMKDGRSASQYGNRGAQSVGKSRANASRGGGGGRARGGGGGRGGGGRGGGGRR